jgi:hypothetical protein
MMTGVGMNNIIINGKRFSNIVGNNISITDGNIIVDGQVISEGNSGIVKIQWEGDLANLSCHNAEISGNVQGNVSGHNIDIGSDVGGNVTGHNIDIGGDIAGNVNGKNVR